MDLKDKVYKEVAARCCEYIIITEAVPCGCADFYFSFIWMGETYRAQALNLPNVEAVQVRFMVKEILRVVLNTEIE